MLKCQNIVVTAVFYALMLIVLHCKSSDQTGEVALNSRCGPSYDGEKFSELCRPEFCGIRTRNNLTDQDFVAKAKTLTRLIFDKIDGDTDR